MTLFSEKTYISSLLNYKPPVITQEERIKNAIKIIRGELKTMENNEEQDENDNLKLTKFESLLFIKFGLTYHLNQGRDHLTPVSSLGTIENNSTDDEIEDFVNARYSRSVSSPY